MSPDRAAPAPLVVFSDDWGRHPSSTQHLVRRMLGRRTVIWVNTIGTRRPRLCLADFRRGLAKLQQWLTPASPTSGAAASPIVLNPPMWPDCSSRWARALNTRLIARAVNRALEQHCDREPVVLTTVPLTADLHGAFPAARWVYSCVDDWSTWPGLDHHTLAALERDLLAKVDATAAASDHLAAHLREHGHSPLLLTHGVDLPMWRTPVTQSHPTLEALAQLPRPLTLCWGLVDSKLDADVIRSITARNLGSLAFIGPLGDQHDTITSIPGITHLPGVPHELLPAAAAQADALLMPYRADHPALIASQPLKLMEYLATDKPVITTPLPASLRWADCCDIAGDNLADVLANRLHVGVPQSQLHARSNKLPGESWDAKAALLEVLLEPVTTGATMKEAA